MMGQVFVWTPVFNSLGYIPRSAVAGLQGNSPPPGKPPTLATSNPHQHPGSAWLTSPWGSPSAFEKEAVSS